MTFNFIYEPAYYPQIIFAVMVDARKGTPLANQIGDVIKVQVDNEVNKVTDDVLFYKIEGDNNVLAGYMSLTVTNMGQTAGKLQQVVRPNFQSFITDINQQANEWITSGSWKPDFLL